MQELAAPLHFVEAADLSFCVPDPHMALLQVATAVQHAIAPPSAPIAAKALPESWYFPAAHLTAVAPH